MSDFNKTLDALPHGPDWRCQEVTIKATHGQEVVELWYWNTLEGVRKWISNPRFRQALRYAPEEHFTVKDRGTRVFSEMWTGLWWAQIQVCTNLA